LRRSRESPCPFTLSLFFFPFFSPVCSSAKRKTRVDAFLAGKERGRQYTPQSRLSPPSPPLPAAPAKAERTGFYASFRIRKASSPNSDAFRLCPSSPLPFSLSLFSTPRPLLGCGLKTRYGVVLQERKDGIRRIRRRGHLRNPFPSFSFLFFPFSVAVRVGASGRRRRALSSPSHHRSRTPFPLPSKLLRACESSPVIVT